jgi:hypothetical protein
MKNSLRLALLGLLLCSSARGQEVQTGSIMICDTQKQVQRLAAVFSGNLQSAIKVVNAEEDNPMACTIADSLS